MYILINNTIYHAISQDLTRSLHIYFCFEIKVFKREGHEMLDLMAFLLQFFTIYQYKNVTILLMLFQLLF